MPRASNASIRGKHLRDGALVDGTAHEGALVDRAAAEDEGVVGEHVEGWWVGFSEDDVSMLKTCGGRRVWSLL
jgi:hypothetical protein